MELSRLKKRLISTSLDTTGLLIIAILAIWLRMGEIAMPISEYIVPIFLLPLLAIPVFILLGLYRAVVRYISHRFVFVVFSAVSLSFLLWSTAIFMLGLPFPRSALIIAWLMALLFVFGSRIIARLILTGVDNSSKNTISVVIYGAGASGRQLMTAMETVAGRKVVAFIDDKKNLYQQKIASVKVYSKNDLSSLIARFNVKEVLLAIPSLKSYDRKKLLTWIETYPVKVSTLPSIKDIVDGKVSFSDIKEVSVDDILGRESVEAKEDLLSLCVTDKVVMVTGGGGSIGSEICRQVLKQSPKILIIYEQGEFSLYEINHNLKESLLLKSLSTELVPVLGDVKNEARLSAIITRYAVETIYHAAAYKHVPLVEHNIAEGILNNTFGTFSVAKVAAQNKVRNFVLISTDKAVRPTNFMGASKRLAEMSLQAMQEVYPATRFVMVRFGNVLGSSGSVIPLFKKQIAQGGPVTVTHKEITRYFMTIPEAASLVIQAGSMGKGGDVFVLDMGEPVNIADLAKKIIRLSGLEIIDSEGHGDIAIKYTGLRPGEKLYEELLIGDSVDGTNHPRIMSAHECYIPYEEIQKEFDEMAKELDRHDYEAVSNRIYKLVSGFQHTSGVVDYLSRGLEL